MKKVALIFSLLLVTFVMKAQTFYDCSSPTRWMVRNIWD